MKVYILQTTWNPNETRSYNRAFGSKERMVSEYQKLLVKSNERYLKKFNETIRCETENHSICVYAKNQFGKEVELINWGTNYETLEVEN